MIRLEPFTEDDFARLISWLPTEASLVQFTGSRLQFPLTHQQLMFHRLSRGKKIFRVVDENSGDVIGHGEIGEIDERNRCASLCRLLIGPPELRGKGYGGELVRQLLVLCFDGLQLHRVDLNVYDFNHPAIACYIKQGFTEEGRLRESTRIGDEYWTSIRMSMLSHEWEKIRDRK